MSERTRVLTCPNCLGSMNAYDRFRHDPCHVYVLLCRTCGGDNPIPFSTPEERGRWAAEHTAGTGHDRWWSKDVVIPNRSGDG